MFQSLHLKIMKTETEIEKPLGGSFRWGNIHRRNIKAQNDMETGGNIMSPHKIVKSRYKSMQKGDQALLLLTLVETLRHSRHGRGSLLRSIVIFHLLIQILRVSK